LQQQIQIDTAVVNLGVEVPKSYFYDRYNLPMPKGGEEVVQRRETAAAPAAGQANAVDKVDAMDGVDGEVAVNSEQPAGTHAALAGETPAFRGIAKSLAKMQEQIRAAKNLKELKAINYEWFAQEIGAELANNAVEAYVKGRKAKRSKSRKNAGLPEIRWEWDESGIEAANAFRNQAHIISAVRTGAAFKQLWEDAAKVLEEGGSFADFIAKATLSGFAPDNPYHLKTEFETSAAAGEMAGRWDEIEADADLFPYLRYVTMQDELVRDEHLALDGTVAAVNDPFWDENYPPNGYNCRCYVEQLTEDEAKNDPKWDATKPTLTKDDNFKANVGKSKVLPSDAYDSLWDFAQKVIDQLPNSEAGDSVICAAKLPKGVILDSKNYPVDLKGSADNDQVKLAIGQPTEIWHNYLNESSYIKRFSDKVLVVQVMKGIVQNVNEYDNYENQGRNGVREA
jgi:SPP1 gp7 family putative phage head morphogenesis protein